ncbi:MAG: Fic family protein [Sarcina sp.]
MISNNKISEGEVDNMTYKKLASLFYSNKNEFTQIYNQRYNAEGTYRFGFNVKNNPAFLVITSDILKLSEKIHEMDKELFKLTLDVPQIALSEYINTCLIDEIRVTNEIEGVASTRKEISEIINDKEAKFKKKRLYGLVKKYEMLTEEEIKLETCEDIKKLYNEFVLNEVLEEDKENKPDGEFFRTDVVFIKNESHAVIHEGVYPETKIIEYMTKCLGMLENKDYGFLIKIAVFHYMFGYIHPFYDGNGRMSRFISSYLISKKLNKLVAYRLAYTVKKNINSYYKSFKETNEEKNKGDLTLFTTGFLKIIIESLEDLCAALEERISRLNYFNDIANKYYGDDEKLFNTVSILVQNSLFGGEGLSVSELAYKANVGATKIRTYMKMLEVEGVLKKSKVGRKNLYNINLDSLGEKV